MRALKTESEIVGHALNRLATALQAVTVPGRLLLGEPGCREVNWVGKTSRYLKKRVLKSFTQGPFQVN